MKIETFSIEKAHRAQFELSKLIVLKDRLPSTIRNVVGIDVAYTSDLSIAAAVLLDFDTLRLKESKTAFRKTVFPYVATLLSFREIPVSVAAVKMLQENPDIILADGQGYAHPYRCGFASHLGLVLRKPVIGVAKTRLIGIPSKDSSAPDTVFLRDKGQIIGAQIATKHASKPVYVSVGHMISLDTAIRIFKHCVTHSRIPEPIAMAHRVAAIEKRKLNILTE